MPRDFTEYDWCERRRVCWRCRNDAEFRERYGAPATCPRGVRFGIVSAIRSRISEFMRTRSFGIGDTFAKLTRLFGVPHCRGCERRRRWFNRILPYKGRRA